MKPRPVVVPVSGGKDSQACLKLAVETFGPEWVRGLFCDTQYEHPLTYAHLDTLERLYGVGIKRICAGSVEEECLKAGRLPSALSRFCTKSLKIRPSKRVYATWARAWGPLEVWYGMRNAESPARAARYAGKVGDTVFAPHEMMKEYPQYLEKLGVMFRLPVLEWSEKDIKEYVGVENLNPLYQWFDRVGCFPCEASGEEWREKAYNHDEFGQSQYRKVIRIAQQIGKPVWRTKSRQHLNNCGSGCSFCEI